MRTTPLIPTTVIGSWSFPGWFDWITKAWSSDPGLTGAADRAELIRDAVRLAINDQLESGLDRISDGEMQRVDFNLGFYAYLSGIEPLPASRKLGAPAHDQRDKYVCINPIAAPKGLGVVDDYRLFRSLTKAPSKVPIPGAFTLAGCIGGGEVYRNRKELTEALIPIVNAEMKAAVAEGADFIQLDEPSFACHPDEPDYFLDVIARTTAGVNAYISMHMCFGNYRARAVGWRSYAPLFPHIGDAKVNQLALEFASREMSEISLLSQLPESMDVAVGLIDVKNTWIEPAALVAERLRSVLRILPPERVSVTPDCGFSQTARPIALAKTKAMVDGVKIIRSALGLKADHG